MKHQQQVQAVSSEGPLSREEQWKYLYQARTYEVTRLHKALAKRARQLRGMRVRVERLEKRLTK